jgi:hypothetical protein
MHGQNKGNPHPVHERLDPYLIDAHSSLFARLHPVHEPFALNIWKELHAAKEVCPKRLVYVVWNGRRARVLF